MCNQYAWIFPKERSFAEMPSSSRSGETLKDLRAMETYKQQKKRYQFACFCSSTMLTSKKKKKL